MSSNTTLLSILFFFMGLGSSLSQHQLPELPDWSNQDRPDWLLDGASYQAGVYQSDRPNEIVLGNGLLKKTFKLEPNAAAIGFENLMTGETLLRGVKPEGILVIDSTTFPIGGLKGQTNYAFLRRSDVDQLTRDTSSLLFTGFEVKEPDTPLTWKRVRYHAAGLSWPPKGIHLRLDFQIPEGRGLVSVHYEMYDGLPVVVKWLTIKNTATDAWVLNGFTSELLAAVEYGSAVESRKYNVRKPNIHVETDYAFASFNVDDANHHVVHWGPDPDYHTQVNYLKQTPCLLTVSPEIGPEQEIAPGEELKTFRTFMLPYDSYERERQGLSLRRMYRTLAPWITENPLMMHARFADWDRVKKAIDQCAEVGFEMVILTFGSGFNIEDDSEAYLSKMKQYADYAHAKGIEIGGYSLLASRSIGPEQDVVMPPGEKPTFGHSPCIGSEWGNAYFQKLYDFYRQTGFSLLEHDGSYPGDVCTSESHPGHRGFSDSRWNQYQVIASFYKWCRAQGIYLNVPDYYYLSGSNKCGMGYREVNWSLPRAQQVLHTRQNIYDGSWTKTPSMGWMFVPLTEYHGGGAAATIEPLEKHLDHYRQMLVSNLGGGVQACYRGPRLYDAPQTREMVRSVVEWFKNHREVLEGDIIHLRRADGRDLDYWLNVNPGGVEKGMLMVFNPLEEKITRSIRVPIYYTGLTEQAVVVHEDGSSKVLPLSRNYELELELEVPAKGYTWYVIK